MDAEKPMGQGACTLADLFEPGHERQGANMLARALKAGYVDIFSINYVYAKKKAMEMTEDKDARVKAAGTKLLVEMAKHDLKLLEVVSGASENSPVQVNMNVVNVNASSFRNV